MLLIDSRIGSVDLVAPLKKAGLLVEKTHLDFGDVAFEGNGEKGKIFIGIELKKLPDLVGSLRSGRLQGHQLPGLREVYDRVWLLVEGEWHHNDAGLVTVRAGRSIWRPIPGRMTTAELDKTLLTLELKGGLYVHQTTVRKDTVRFIHSLYRWWTDQAFEEHRSHLAAHTPPSLVPLSQFRRTVCTLPGIGVRTSLFVEQHFRGSLYEALGATAEEWANIQTKDDKGKPRRLGDKDGERIFNALRQET